MSLHASRRPFLASLTVGGVTLRSLGKAALSTAATVAVEGVRKATTHAAGLVATATLAAVVATKRDVSAGLSAEARFAGILAKATAHTAALGASATFSAVGIQKKTTHSAPIATSATFRVRLQRAGYTRVSSSGDRRVTSSGDVRVAVQTSS